MGAPSEESARPCLHATRRLAHLDALRGVAVGLVLCQHVGERTSSALAGFSLERAGSLRVFWVNRVFRLYPLYWLSLAGAALLMPLGVHHPPTEGSVRAWLADVTMLKAFVGQSDALVLYWSLAWELAFYAAISALFLVGLNRRSVALSVVCDVAVVLGVAALGLSGHREATYRWLEAPLITVGHRYARRIAAARQEPCTVTRDRATAPGTQTGTPEERVAAVG